MIKFWDPAKQYLKHKDEIDQAIEDVLLSGNLVLGSNPAVGQFEESFANFLGVKHAITCGAGTQALYLAYKVLGIGPGDEVVVPSNTFIATIDQIVALGATPIVVDCDEDGLMDIDEALKALTVRTRAVVPVHMEGKVCQFACRLQQTYPNLYIINDSAQAIGAAGATDGTLSCYSLFPAKILGSKGNLGVVVTNDDQLADRLRMLRCNSNIGKNPDMDAELGTNMEPDVDDIAVAGVRLKYLRSTLDRRKEVAERYFDAFQGLPFRLPLKQEGRVYQDFMILTPERDSLKGFLKERGVQALIPNPRIPNHHYTVLGHFKLPNTDRYVSEKLALPCNDTITDEEVGYVIDKVKEFYAG